MFRHGPHGDVEGANWVVEVQIMRGVNHQSIVKLHQFFESDEHYFLVLERTLLIRLSIALRGFLTRFQ